MNYSRFKCASEKTDKGLIPYSHYNEYIKDSTDHRKANIGVSQIA